MTNRIQTRESNFELLRCLLMLFVVIIHFIGHNILSKDNPVQVGEMNYFTSNLMHSFCVCAVDCFVLISGYFTIKVSLRKIILFLLPIFFYELLLSTICYPITHHFLIPKFNYWFIRCYLALMILSPLLNCGLSKLKGEILRNILLLSIFFYILPINSPSFQAGKNIYIFILLYMTGYYIRNFFTPKLGVAGYFACYIVTSIFIFVETYILHILGMNKGVDSLSYSYDNVLIYMSAFFLFLSFSKLKIRSKIINYVASSAFYVYIISENPNIRTDPCNMYSWMNVNSWASHPLFALLIFLGAIGVFLVSILIDKLRIILFGHIEKKLGDKIDSWRFELMCDICSPKNN